MAQAGRAVVTGGAGFIGSHVVDRLLDDGHKVWVVDDLSSGRRENLDPNATLVATDISDPDMARLFAEVKPDLVVHAAAQISVSRSTREPLFDARVNVMGSLNLLETSRANDVRKFLFVSTGGAMYGEPDRLPVDETHPPRPASPYGASKLAVEGYLGTYQAAYGLDYTVVRLGNVYGPRQDPHGEAGVVAIFSRAMLAGGEVRIFGDGMDERDYVYVGDVVDAMALAVDRGSGAVYNIGTGIGTNVNTLFARLAGLTGYEKDPIYGPPRAGDIHAIRLDAARAHRELGWTPHVSLEDGLSRTVDYFRAESKAQ